jgi:hypothetical protein
MFGQWQHLRAYTTAQSNERASALDLNGDAERAACL